MSSMSLEAKASQVLMTSIDGKYAFPKHLTSHFRGVVPGAVLLFGFNIADSPSGVRQYIESCNRAFANLGGDVPVLFAVDNEGGSVFRTDSVMRRLPSARAVSKRLTPLEAEELYARSARDLSALGIHLNLAPVAEVSPSSADDFLGDRTYGSDPSLVSSYALAAFRGYARSGVISCAKHFPGTSREDPHLKATELNASIHELRSRYAASFLPLFASGLQALLVTGVRVSAIEPDVPFCLSKKGVTGFLRNELSYTGLVITDDIAMAAITPKGEDVAFSAVRAIHAGVDCVMVSSPSIRPIARSIAERATEDTQFAERLDEAVTRIIAVKISAGLVPTSLRALALSKEASHVR